jgi:hypothetical protein
MNKLDYVIGHFFAVAKGDVAPDARSDAGFLSAALEEIRDLLTADKQPNTEDQPTTFEPWDCVRAKPGTELHTYVGDVELVCGHFDSDGDRRVFNPDSDEMHTAYFYSKDSDLIFVRRLKPRTQAEPRFKCGDLVRNIFDIEEYTYEVMHDTNGPRVQLRDCKTGQPRAFDADDLRKVEKPAPFQVGDWVRDNAVMDVFQVAYVEGDCVLSEGRLKCRHISGLEKIDPPAPRFTFGDRVVHYDVTGLFIRYVRSQIGITKEQCQFLGLTDNNIHTCYAEELSLLDELPF